MIAQWVLDLAKELADDLGQPVTVEHSEGVDPFSSEPQPEVEQVVVEPEQRDREPCIII